jgi:hypothetical protein
MHYANDACGISRSRVLPLMELAGGSKAGLRELLPMKLGRKVEKLSNYASEYAATRATRRYPRGRER